MEKKQQNGHFKKVIGLFGGISLVAGMTIGSGVYYLGSSVSDWLFCAGSSVAWFPCWAVYVLQSWGHPARLPVV